MFRKYFCDYCQMNCDSRDELLAHVERCPYRFGKVRSNSDKHITLPPICVPAKHTNKLRPGTPMPVMQSNSWGLLPEREPVSISMHHTNSLQFMQRCQICNAQFYNTREIDFHYMGMHFICPIKTCRVRCASLVAVEEHLRRFHGINPNEYYR